MQLNSGSAEKELRDNEGPKKVPPRGNGNTGVPKQWATKRPEAPRSLGMAVMYFRDDGSTTSDDATEVLVSLHKWQALDGTGNPIRNLQPRGVTLSVNPRVRTKTNSRRQ